VSTIDLLAATGTDTRDCGAACPISFGLLNAGSDVQVLCMFRRESMSSRNSGSHFQDGDLPTTSVTTERPRSGSKVTHHLLRRTALLDTYVAHIFASRSHLAPPRISYRPSKCKPPLDAAGRRSVRRYNMRGDESMHSYGGFGTTSCQSPKIQIRIQ
jgi:hypothetical protein